MPDQYYDDEYETDTQPSLVKRAGAAVSTLIGALVAFALLLGLGLWFYRLGVRDAQTVPVIRAAAEPSKQRPVDPGGAVTPHQSVSSYETVEGDAPRAASAALVQAAPPEPRPEDVPMRALVPVKPAPKPEPVKPAAPEPVQAETAQVELAAAPAEPAPLPQSEEPKVFPEATALAPTRSPMAPSRPTDLAKRFAAAKASQQNAGTELAARAAASRDQIQLMANPDADVVRAEWKRIFRANRDILGERALSIQSIQSGGKTMYRLRVGPFRDRSEANTICKALKARGQDCIVARNG